jgi:hypothetical protein
MRLVIPTTDSFRLPEIEAKKIRKKKLACDLVL